VISVVLARLLGPSGLGDYNLLLSLVVVLLAVGTLGLDFGLSYAVARNEWSPKQALAQSQFAGLCLGLCALGVGSVTYLATRNTVFSGIDETEVLLALACLPFALTTQLAGALALAVDRYEIAALVPCLQSGLALVVTAVLAPLLGLEGALAGFLLAYLLSAVVLLIANVRAVGLPPPNWVEATWARCRSAVRFGFGLSLTSALWLVIQRLDLFLLSAFVSSTVLGQYALAFSITTAQLLLPRALGQVLLPRIARLGTASEKDQRTVTTKSLRHGVLLVTLTALGMAALLPLIPLVFGDQFGATVPLAEVLVPGVAAAGLISVMSPALVGHGRARQVTRLGVLGLLLAGVLYGIFIPLFEAWGAAFASSAVYLLIAAIYASALHRTGVVQSPSDWRPSREELNDYRTLGRALGRRMRSA
jgi:antigen flippase